MVIYTLVTMRLIPAEFSPVCNVTWGIVNEAEIVPGEDIANQRAKFLARKQCTLATIVQAVDPTFLLSDWGC